MATTVTEFVRNEGGVLRSRAWRLPLLLALVTILLIITQRGGVLQNAYAFLAIAVGTYMYVRYPLHYVGYVFWLIFLSPEVRRFADFYNGAFNPTSVVQAAPLMVLMLSCFSFIRWYRLLGTRQGIPFLLILLGISYGYTVGVISAGFAAASFGLINWLGPVALAFHMLTLRQSFPRVRDLYSSVFTWGSIVMGLYGLVQYALMPAWDASWLIGSGLTSSAGQPVPFAVRVFGPTNSPGVFALILMGAIFICAVHKGVARFPAIFLVIVNLLLTFGRSSWGGAALAFAYLFLFSKAKVRFKAIIAVLAFAALVLPLTAINSVSDRLIERWNTIANLQDDNSYNSRSALYSSDFFSQALSNVGGAGIGVVGIGTRLAGSDSGTQLYEVLDSGVAEVPLVLGWPGTLLYVLGVGTLLWRALVTTARLKRDRSIVPLTGVAIAIFAQMVFANTLTGVSGIMFFTCVAFSILAGRAYAQSPKLPRLSEGQADAR